MKELNLRSLFLSAVAGVVFASAMLLAVSYTPAAFANEPIGGICQDTIQCQGGYCFTNGAGQSSCKYNGSPAGCPTKCTQLE